MIGELINKITLKGKVKRNLIERRAMTRISARNTYMYLLRVVQVRNKIQKRSLKTCVEHAMKADRGVSHSTVDNRILLTTCSAV